MGKVVEAEAMMDQAIKHPTADVIQIHRYGRQLLGAGMKDKALKIFEYNYKHHGEIGHHRPAWYMDYQPMAGTKSP